MPLPAALIPILASAAGGAASSLFSGSGSQGGFQQRPRLSKSQMPLYKQLQAANMGQGAGGSFGQSADYYRDLLNDDSQTMDQLSAPEMRRFNEEIIPGISEQFAGMGSGGLSSSGFRNAAVNAGTDLSERLGAIRANLRSQGAAGLSNIGQLGLGDYTNNTYQQNAPGFLESVAPALGKGLASYGSDYLNNKPSQQNNSAPTPLSQQSPIQPQAVGQPGFNLPQFSTKGRTSPYGGIR